MDWGVWMWAVIDAIAVAVLGGGFAYGAYMRRNPTRPAIERAPGQAGRGFYHPDEGMSNKRLTG